MQQLALAPLLPLLSVLFCRASALRQLLPRQQLRPLPATRRPVPSRRPGLPSGRAAARLWHCAVRPATTARASPSCPARSTQLVRLTSSLMPPTSVPCVTSLPLRASSACAGDASSSWATRLPAALASRSWCVASWALSLHQWTSPVAAQLQVCVFSARQPPLLSFLCHTGLSTVVL